MAKDVNAELVAAFDVVRRKFQRVLNARIADKIEIKHLKGELAIALEDIDSLIVTVNPRPKEAIMAKTPPQSAQNSPIGTTIPTAASIRLLGSGLFTLSGGVVLLNGSAEAAGNKPAVELELTTGPDGKPQLKATDSNGDVTVWTADVKPEDPQGSWSATTAP
jgi:hypothetical protein